MHFVTINYDELFYLKQKKKKMVKCRFMILISLCVAVPLNIYAFNINVQGRQQ